MLGMSTDWEKVSFVKRSKYRKKILEKLDEPKTPTELSYDIDAHRPHVSRALGELKDQKLVEILNPDDKMGRLYRITDEGEEIRYEIE